MKTKLINNNSDKLIIFLTGWGCDYRQFANMKSFEYDILFCFDYSNLNLDFDFSPYNEINLICFSAGVYIAGIIRDKLPKLNKKIAINGNPFTFDKNLGLSIDMVKVFENISKENAIDFRRDYMVINDTELNLFNKLQPHRSLESCSNELKKLIDYANLVVPMKFDEVLLSDKDKIFDIKKQKEFFKNTQIKVIKDAAHFPFFKFETFEELLG